MAKMKIGHLRGEIKRHLEAAARDAGRTVEKLLKDRAKKAGVEPRLIGCKNSSIYGDRDGKAHFRAVVDTHFHSEADADLFESEIRDYYQGDFDVMFGRPDGLRVSASIIITV